MATMSWGFAEGQAVFASDETMYDSYFDVPGVTFVASTGDYGAADPEYPAFSPNVVAVGGTSLTLNADNSYSSGTGWGYYSSSAGALIGSGGGISLYEPEPAYQQGAQSTGYRTTPDVSMVADPATGAWIADTYNRHPSNPFAVVGGTSLSAPAWAGLFALANQGRAAAGESSLNRITPTAAQHALYMLPQTGYNSITGGSNGYTANAGYNLVTGFGTPVANLLVPDLIAYQGTGTVYSGATVGPLQDAGLIDTGTGSGSTSDVFSVFNALTAVGGGPGQGGLSSAGGAPIVNGHNVRTHGAALTKAIAMNSAAARFVGNSSRALDGTIGRSFAERTTTITPAGPSSAERPQ
jgi:subtilase family serine protease